MLQLFTFQFVFSSLYFFILFRDTILLIVLQINDVWKLFFVYYKRECIKRTVENNTKLGKIDFLFEDRWDLGMASFFLNFFFIVDAPPRCVFKKFIFQNLLSFSVIQMVSFLSFFLYFFLLFQSLMLFNVRIFEFDFSLHAIKRTE